MISAAELILTNRGSIYHLNLTPDEIADTIITVGDPARVVEVSKHFDNIEFKRHHREFVTHTGTFNNKRISVVSTGIGTDNIDIVLNELDALVNIDFIKREPNQTHRSLNIIRIGTSGSLQADIDVDSFVASEAAIGVDNLMKFYDLQNDDNDLVEKFNKDLLSKIGTSAYYFTADAALLKRVGDGMHKGITATCPGFYGPQGRTLRIKPKDKSFIDKLQTWQYKNMRITNFEMETSGIYGMSRLLGHRALSLSAIVANRTAGTFSKKHEATVERLITTVLERL